MSAQFVHGRHRPQQATGFVAAIDQHGPKVRCYGKFLRRLAAHLSAEMLLVSSQANNRVEPVATSCDDGAVRYCCTALWLRCSACWLLISHQAVDHR